MKYPLHLITIPGHNFVRWIPDADNALNFETMDGKITDDGYYINGWGIPAKYVHVDGILNTLDEKETFAYHDALDGITLSWRGKYNEMVSQYLLSIQRDPVPSFSANNLGWFYAIAPGSYNDGKQAVKYASQAAAQFPAMATFSIRRRAPTRVWAFSIRPQRRRIWLRVPTTRPMVDCRLRMGML